MGRMSVEFSRGPHCWCSIGGRLLGMGRWNGGYIRNFPLLIFGAPIAPTVPTFSMVVDLSLVLDKFVFVF